MAVNTKAKYYQWFMTDDPTQRVIAFEWWPKDGVITSSMGIGKLFFYEREEPGDTWGPPKTISDEIMWVVAQNLVRSEGFHVEVEVTE